MPVARLPKLSDRTSGVLLHPTSLPGGADGGELGGEARRFVDFLAAAGQSWWQMLPVGPTGYAQFPLQRASRRLRATRRWSPSIGWSTTACCRAGDRGKPRDEQLRAAFAAFRARRRPRATSALSPAGAAGWLDDFALYCAIKRAHGERSGRCGRRGCAIATRARWPRRAPTLADEIAFVALRAVALRARLARCCATTRTRAASA